MAKQNSGQNRKLFWSEEDFDCWRMYKKEQQKLKKLAEGVRGMNLDENM